MGGIRVPQDLFLKRLKSWRRYAIIFSLISAVQAVYIWRHLV